MTYYDRLKEFYRLNENEPYPAYVQLVMLYLLQINNVTGNTGKFHCSDNRLAFLTSLSKDTITRAKRYLKNEGLIDFQSDKKNPRKGTLYILPEKETQKPYKKQDKLQNVSVEKVVAQEPPKAITPVRNLTASSEEVATAWFKAEQEYPYGFNDQWLSELEQLYGTEKVVSAIKTATASNTEPKLNINYIRKILNNWKEGGTRNDKNRSGGEVSRVSREDWEQQSVDEFLKG